MKVIPNLKYTDKHEWVKIDGEFAYIGITAYAQNQLGEVLFVEMGEVVEINERLDDEPEYINEDPYDAWIVKVRVADEDELENLLNSDSYEASID